MKIYTKTGDAGETGLFGGPRVRKDDVRIEVYGTVDELNAALGVVRAEPLPEPLGRTLLRVQSELFSVGAELATPDPFKHGTALIGEPHVVQLEQEIDHLEAGVTPLRRFILPAGNRAAATLHLARGICRRAERRLVTLAATEPNLRDGRLVRYLNRLGDYLFVAARYANAEAKIGETEWQKPESASGH